MRARSVLLIATATLALFASSPSSGSAGTLLQPTKFTDSADGACNSDCSLREAVIEAATSGTTTIRLESGRYDLTLGSGDGRETDPSSGDLDLAGELVIEGTGETSIDANGLFTVLHVLPGANVMLSGITVFHGFGYAGAGLYNDGAVRLEDCIVSDNNSDGLTGGGISNHGEMLIQRCLIAGNTTGETGGAGGGIASRTGSLTVVSSTVAQNTAAFAGGGIMRDGGDAASLTNVTIAENHAGLEASATSGGGGLVGWSLISNSVISSNTADFAPDCMTSVASLGHNLIGDITDCSLAPDPTDLVGVDPVLGPLTGGEATLAYYPGVASPLIDAGDDAACPAFDQRGHPRPSGSHCDIGAIEIGGTLRLWGDVDCDSDLSSRDNQAELRQILGQNPLSQTEPCPDIATHVDVAGADRLWGDDDCDGEITTRDNQAKLRRVLQQNPLSQTEPCPDIGTSTEVADG